MTDGRDLAVYADKLGETGLYVGRVVPPYESVVVSDADVAVDLRSRVTPELLDDVLSQVPDGWLEPAPGAAGPRALRDGYRDHLTARLSAVEAWLPRRAAA